MPASDVLDVRIGGRIARLTLARPEKRNAINPDLNLALRDFFSAPPESVRVVILSGQGDHFCAGLDLSAYNPRTVFEAVERSRAWHATMELLQYGGIPIISVLKGAVIGGGLELATSTHVRIAEPSVRFQLPEGKRGIFVGGGASVRVGRLLGPDRMTEMMLTGRTYGHADAVPLGFAHYAVGEGEGMTKAEELAENMAKNARSVTRMILQALPRIHDMARSDGFFTESLIAAMTSFGDDAREGIQAFLEKREPNFD
jgi:enoyl-CoA hydratase/carnithine racemase